MAEFVHVVAASQGLLPDPCPTCLWWQTTQGSDPDRDVEADTARRLTWMRQLEESWGSLGMVLQEGPSTLAALQFAPVKALARASRLPAGPPPEDAILIYCLRGRLDRSAHEPSRLLHRTLGHLRKQRLAEVYAFARPLGSVDLCGLRNLCGLEFLRAHGFEIVRGGGDAFLMRLDLRGLLPSLKEAASGLRWVRPEPATPSPAIFGEH
jgi:hypothetical protein